MLLLVGLLLICTLLLLAFFISHCALLPRRAHACPHLVPYSVVKSPRRTSAFTDPEDGSLSPARSMHSFEYLHRKLEEKCRPRSRSADVPRPKDDYLHPKYSLPPGKYEPDWQMVLTSMPNSSRPPNRANLGEKCPSILLPASPCPW